MNVEDGVLTGMNGNSFGQKRIGKLLAVVWLLTAAFAMQVVSSAQGLSLRGSGQQSSGNVSEPMHSAPDPVLSARVIRATPATDLRFTAERSEAKPLPIGPDTPTLPSRLVHGMFASLSGLPCPTMASVRSGVASHHIRVRAPPFSALA